MSAIWSRVNTLLLVLVLMGLIAVIGELGTRAWGGPLDPPGAPGATQPQVEPRSPIPPVGWDGSFPITISAPGSYFLTRDLTAATDADGIHITSSDVALDLNGFTLTGTAFRTGVNVIAGGAQRIVIRNGSVTSWDFGVDLGNSVGAQADSLIVSNNSGTGLTLGPGGMAHHITAQHDGTGIAVIDGTPTFGGGLIDGCVATKNGWGVYLYANNVTVEHCDLDSNTQSGLNVHIGVAFDVIMDNTAQGDPTGVYLEEGTIGNTVIRNMFALNTNTPVLDSGTNNRVGPVGSVANAGAFNNVGP